MNIAHAIMYLFPQASPMHDFVVQDDSDGNGAYLAKWNLENPQPTQEELEAAWEAYIALPDVPAPLSEIEVLKAENETLKAQITLIMKTLNISPV